MWRLVLVGVCQKALTSGRDKALYGSLDDTLFAGDSMIDIAKAAADRGMQMIVFDEVHRYSKWTVFNWRVTIIG